MGFKIGYEKTYRLESPRPISKMCCILFTVTNLRTIFEVSNCFVPHLYHFLKSFLASQLESFGPVNNRFLGFYLDIRSGLLFFQPGNL